MPRPEAGQSAQQAMAVPAPLPLDLARLIRPGDRVVVAQGCAEPQTLTRGLVEAHSRCGPFETFIGPIFTASFEAAADMRFASYGAMGGAAQLARARRLDIWPMHYGDISEGFASGRLRADVVLLQLARAPDGRLCVTLSNDYALAAAPHARIVVAEVNAQAPWCCGAEIGDLRIDHIVETDRPLPALAAAPLGHAEQVIGRRVAGLVGDRATLQLGIGALPDAILAALTHHRDLGLHSGMISDGVMPLLEAGVITNAAKSRDAGLTVTNTAFGTRRLYDHLDGNPQVRLAPVAYTHAFGVVASQANFVAINAALEVDLEGNVNCEAVDGRAVGGAGGLLDFTRGARAAAGGRAITVLRATDRTGSRSRIVHRVAAVTVPKTDVDVVVTEFGVADLRRLGQRARAQALIAIASPSAREDLARQHAEERLTS